MAIFKRPTVEPAGRPAEDRKTQIGKVVYEGVRGSFCSAYAAMQDAVQACFDEHPHHRLTKAAVYESVFKDENKYLFSVIGEIDQ